MLNKSKKAKGKMLEKFVAKAMGEIFSFSYSRADSGSGLEHKEDVSLPTDVPLHIECKNQAEINISRWWDETIDGCPAYRYPVLIYRLNFQKDPSVVMRMCDLLSFLSGKKIEFGDEISMKVTFTFSDFVYLLKKKYADKHQG